MYIPTVPRFDRHCTVLQSYRVVTYVDCVIPFICGSEIVFVAHIQNRAPNVH